MSSLEALPSHLLLLTILRVATLTEQANFTSARHLPVRILSEVLARYVQLVGSQAKSRAESSGRTQCNLPDVIAALGSLGIDGDTIQDWLIDAKRSTQVTDGEGATELNEMSKQLQALPEPSTSDLYTYRRRTAEEMEELAQADAAAAASRISTAVIKPPSSPIASDKSDSDSDQDPMEVDQKPAKADLQAALGAAEQSKPIEVEDSDDSQEPETPVESLWQSVEDIPDHIPSFFPPLPGYERAQAYAHRSEPSRRQNLRLSKRAQADPLHRPDLTAHLTGAHVDPWRHEIPYDRSSIAEAVAAGYSTASLPMLSPPGSPKDRPQKTSLPSYYQAYRELAEKPQLVPQPLRTAKGKKAAEQLSLMTHTGADSLFGNMKPIRPNFQRKTPGWLPYPLRLLPSDPDPTFHPFELKASLIEPLSFPIRSAEPLIPHPHGRSSTIYASLTRPLTALSSPRLFNRTTRMGQPAPLGPNGESWPYILANDSSGFDPNNLAMVQQARKVQPGFETRSADWRDEELPKPPAAKRVKLEEVDEASLEKDKGPEIVEETPQLVSEQETAVQQGSANGRGLVLRFGSSTSMPPTPREEVPEQQDYQQYHQDQPHMNGGHQAIGFQPIGDQQEQWFPDQSMSGAPNGLNGEMLM